jgi:RND family efflux transporter MFP subunit
MRFILKFIVFSYGLIAGPVYAAAPLDTTISKMLQMPLEYKIDGVIEARQQATLSAEVAGKIEAVNFDVDDFVKQGEVVLRIRDREYVAQQKQASAAVDEAKANLQDMQLAFKRNEGLRKQKLISQAVFDKSSANHQAAQARMASAHANLAQADELRSHTVLRAPYSGVVVERHVEPGESVSPGQPIMTGYALGQLRVSANVPQSIIDGLRNHRLARVIILEDNHSIGVSKITIHPFANPKNHSFPVRLELPQMERRLYPGMLVKVAITIGSTQRLVLPQRALVSRAEVNAVYVLDDGGKISFRQVRPGNRYGEQIEILAGLDAGETIALDPVSAGILHKRQLDAAE